jgi:hypothetical protein
VRVTGALGRIAPSSVPSAEQGNAAGGASTSWQRCLDVGLAGTEGAPTVLSMSTFTEFEAAVESLLARTPEQQHAYLQRRYSADGSTSRTPLPLAWSLAHVQPVTAQLLGGEPAPQAGADHLVQREK